MLDIDELADEIKAALGSPVDKDGNVVATTNEMKAFARAVINTLKAGLVANAPGTINGSAAPGGPLLAGVGVGGLVSGLAVPTWLAELTSAFPSADAGQLSAEAAASTGYLMASSLVTFAAGKITGQCTASPVSPGPLVNGAGMDGTIGGLVGVAWAAAVTAAIGGGGPLAGDVYSAAADHIMNKAICAYTANTVVGSFAAGGGPLIGGTGLNGTIE